MTRSAVLVALLGALIGGCVEDFPDVREGDPMVRVRDALPPPPPPGFDGETGDPMDALIEPGPEGEPEPLPLDGGLDGLPPPPPPPDAAVPTDPPDMAPPPRTVYESVAAGANFTCGKRADDARIVCWGQNDRGQLNAPAQPIAHFGLGYDHGCAWDAVATRVRCWGRNDFGEAAPETFNIVDIERFVGGERTTCGLVAGNFACFGLIGRIGLEADVRNHWGSVAVSARHACAHRAARDSIECWGDGSEGRHRRPNGIVFNARTLVGSRNQTCGINLLGGVNCWGPGPPAPGFESFVRLFPSAGDHLCGIRADGTPLCWGQNADGQTDIPNGMRFQQMAAGLAHTCGLDARGHVYCWGRNDHGQTDVP